VSVDRTKSSAAPVRAAAVAAPAPATADFAAVPVEAPSGISAERTAEQGVAGVDWWPGVGNRWRSRRRDGNRAVAVRCLWPHVVRAGNDIKLPRKIKDVKPVYPVSALPGECRAPFSSRPPSDPMAGYGNPAAALRRHAARRGGIGCRAPMGVRTDDAEWHAVAVVITVVVNFALQ